MQLPGQLVVWVRLLQVVQGQSLMQQVACLEPLWVLLVERGPQGQAFSQGEHNDTDRNLMRA